MRYLYLFIFISILKVSEGVLECRNADCVFCKCLSKTHVPQTLTCNKHEFIRLEFYLLRRMGYSDYLGDSCNVIHNESFSCFKTNSETTLVPFEQKSEIYHNCSAKRTCNVTVPIEGPVKVEIPYVCESETFLRKIATRFAQNAVEFPIFYFSGKEFKGMVLNCECKVIIPEPVILEVYFINLSPEACNKVVVSNKNTPIFSCTDNGLQVQYGGHGNFVGDMRIQITDLMVEGDEVLYFKLRGSYMSVNCTGFSVISGVTDKTPPSEASSTMYRVILGTVMGFLFGVFIAVGFCIIHCVRQKKQSRQRGNRSAEQNDEANYEHYTSIDDYTASSQNFSRPHNYLDLINITDGYLTTDAEAYCSNGYMTPENEDLDNSVHHQLIDSMISTGSSYNRDIQSRE